MATHTVTGATGLLGAHLVVNLLQQNKKIRVIHRSSSSFSVLKKIMGYYLPNATAQFNNLELAAADLLDVPALEKALKGTTYLYHCAAVVSFNPKDKYKLLYENPTTTANVVNLALHLNVKKLVYVSSVAALGRKENQNTFNEASHWVEGKGNSAYAKSKYLAEIEVWRGSEEGLPVAVVNPCIIIGPGPWQSGSTALFTRIAKGFNYYSPGVNAYVDARDVADIMSKLMESPIEGERYVVAAENWSYKKFFWAVADALGVAQPKTEVGPTLAAIAWRVEKIKTWLTGKAPLITRETAKTALQECYYDNQKVKEALHFKFKPLPDTIKEIARFYKQDHSN